MIGKKEVIIAVIFFLLGVIIAPHINKPQPSPPTTNKTISTPNPIGFITDVETSKGKVYLSINQDYISFNPFETAVNNSTYITLKKEKYPKLFQQGIANSSIFRAQEYIDPETKETLVKLSNSQPDHGGWASKYVLLINPFTGEIKEGENDYSNEK